MNNCCEKRKEREELWKEYVDLLTAEIDELIGYGIIQGWKPKRFEEEKRLRKALGIEHESEK